MKVTVIANPKSGSYNKEKISQCAAELKRRFGPTSVRLTKGPGDATNIARRVDADLVVAAGGDGLINEVTAGLRGKGSVLFSAMPFGTRNVFCREHNLNKNPLDICKTLNPDEPNSLSMGFIAERSFMLMCGFGFDAAVVNNVVTKGYSKNKTWAHIKEGFKASWVDYPQLKLYANRNEFRPYHIIISIARNYAGSFPLSRQNDDTMLNVYMITKKGVISLALAAVSMVAGFGFPEKSKQMITEVVKVSGTGIVQIDGEAFNTGMNQNYITVEKDVIRLIK